jgi:16S rRNA (adenine1518-N6/adenine1519-N6)-dimethyltransferase
VNRPARKRFGQNFLTDDRVIQRIVDTIAPRDGELLVEIGPGRAALTVALLKTGVDLLVVEIDRDLASDLEHKMSGEPRLRIHRADALQADFGALVQGREYRLVGNLPYNISTPLIFHILDQKHLPVDMHFMLQKEVVQRMASGPGTRRYGRLSLMCQNRCEVIPLFEIGPESFDPKPKVDSGLVRLVPRAESLSGTRWEAALDTVVRQAFSKRRKTLRNSLSGLLNSEQIQNAGVDSAQRAEQLDMDSFLSLARQLDQVSGN